MTTLINQIKSATTRKELREAFGNTAIEVRFTLLSNAVDSLNKEIESDITTGDVNIALFKMSQVVMLEDEKHVVERVMLKQRVVL